MRIHGEYLDAVIAAGTAGIDAWLDSWVSKHGHGLFEARTLVMIGLLLTPLAIALASRRVLPFIVVSLLMFVSFRAYVGPTSLHALSASLFYLGGLIVALMETVSARRRRRLQAEVSDLRAQIDGLRQAEQRRFIVALKASRQVPHAGESVSDEPAPRF